MSDNARKVLGFAVAAGALVVLADYSPTLALTTAAVIGLGVALSHADQIGAILHGFTVATGH